MQALWVGGVLLSFFLVWYGMVRYGKGVRVCVREVDGGEPCGQCLFLFGELGLRGMGGVTLKHHGFGKK